MKLILKLLPVLLLFTGCVSKSEADRRARMAYLAGQNEALKQGIAGQANAGTVWIVGNVRNAHIPWSEDLTLARALVEAEYQGRADPSRIIITRNGQSPIYVSAQQLLNGYDLPILATDRIEIKP